MSYEYKNEIIEDVKAQCRSKNKNIAVYPVYHYEDKVEEIHNVYSQASKADEYEAKAKAWDRTQELLEECTHQTPGDDYVVDWHEFEMKIDDIIEKYESGGSDD